MQTGHMHRDGHWTEDDIPDLSGRVIVVTGASSGLGAATTSALVRHGARVIMACRNVEKGERLGLGGEVRRLDLADLASVRAFAAELPDERVDVLINNAGVMAVPRSETVDGFESQFGTNHLGHFALTGLLLPRLLAAPAPRVVTVSSTAHRFGRIRFDNLRGERRYSAWLAYGQSKLANLLFTAELTRRAPDRFLAVAAHPGLATTDLQTARARMTGHHLEEQITRQVMRVVGQPARMGALPQLYAATAPDVRPGQFYGPDGLLHQHGYPQLVRAARAARDPRAAHRLWDASERLTGVRYAW